MVKGSSDFVLESIKISKEELFIFVGRKDRSISHVLLVLFLVFLKLSAKYNF